MALEISATKPRSSAALERIAQRFTRALDYPRCPTSLQKGVGGGLETGDRFILPTLSPSASGVSTLEARITITIPLDSQPLDDNNASTASAADASSVGTR